MGDTYFPFRNIGLKLKDLRVSANETITEVSASVEIETRDLIQIEAGKELPNEEILLLLISHFDVDEDEAVRLWEMAGYNKQSDKDDLSKQQLVMVMPVDNRIIYAEKTEASVTTNGVILSFVQPDLNKQPSTVTRIGMSREHAQKFANDLAHLLNEKPKVIKALPSPKTTTEKKSKR